MAFASSARESRRRTSDSHGRGDIEMATKERVPSVAEHHGPDEEEETEYKPMDLKKIFLSPKYIPWYIIGIICITLTVIMSVKHDAIVEHLRPFSEKVRDLPAGWLIPIAILFIISFPPLFGHEIVALLCGVVYGLWLGFAIVCAGTFLGEIGTWFAFKYALRSKAAKLERTNLNFAALARLTRDGGFFIVLIIRFSGIPSHFSTAVFSTCDVNFWYFAIATFLTLPKQLFLVYLGVLFLNPQPGSSAKTISFAIAFMATMVMVVYVYVRMRKYKAILLQEQAERKEARRRRMEEAEAQVRMQRAASGGSGGGTGELRRLPSYLGAETHGTYRDGSDLGEGEGVEDPFVSGSKHQQQHQHAYR